MVQRLTYRRRHCYATRSNKIRVVKTPGPQPASGMNDDRCAAGRAQARCAMSGQCFDRALRLLALKQRAVSDTEPVT